MTVVDLVHKEHQRLTKTKQRLNSKVWWAGIHKQVKAKCKTCQGNQLAVFPHHLNIWNRGSWLEFQYHKQLGRVTHIIDQGRLKICIRVRFSSIYFSLIIEELLSSHYASRGTFTREKQWHSFLCLTSLFAFQLFNSKPTEFSSTRSRLYSKWLSCYILLYNTECHAIKLVMREHVVQACLVCMPVSHSLTTWISKVAWPELDIEPRNFRPEPRDLSCQPFALKGFAS